MKMLCFVAAVLAWLPATEVAGGLDPGPDSFGIYFDPNGYSLVADPGYFRPYDAYLIAANPTSPVDAFECTVTRIGERCFILETNLGDGAVDTDATVDGFRVTRATPYPVVSGVVVLVHWVWMQTEVQYGMWVFVGPGTDPLLPGGWPVLGYEGAYRLGDISSGSPEILVACVNNMSACSVADEPTSFGVLKSLYR